MGTQKVPTAIMIREAVDRAIYRRKKKAQEDLFKAYETFKALDPVVVW
jgi:hypothetical protein